MAYDLSSYLWVVIAASIVAFFTAFGIGFIALGANDVANAFATSVGGGALKMKTALIIASIMEFSGASLMGSHVSDTIQTDITDVTQFSDEPEVLMFGMLCVLVCVASWLVIATNYGLPVSTTHSCIGGIIGMAVVAKGWQSVKWMKMVEIVSSWFISPCLSGLVSSILFYCVRRFILRYPNSLERGFFFYPVMIGFTAFVLSSFILFKGTPALKLDMINPWIRLVIAIVIGLLFGVILQYTFVPKMKRNILKKRENAADELKKEKQIQIELDTVVEISESDEKAGVSSDSTDVTNKSDNKEEEHHDTSKIEKKTLMEKQNIHAQLEDEQSKVYQIHEKAEKFDPYTESIFGYLQIVTAIMNSFAHGANDVANAIGPFASILSIYNTGMTTAGESTPLWVLFLGGIGIIAGLACLGYKVMAAIGVNIIKVTPSRGFSIDIGAAFTVVFGSTLGLPLSTTHCIVGSTIGVGLIEGKNSVNWSLVASVFTGWIFTIVICALSTALIFSFGVYSPSLVAEPVANSTALFL
ncbi:hypothetical protein WA158_008029 [Blastocystis sp. Blastoise]